MRILTLYTLLICLSVVSYAQGIYNVEHFNRRQYGAATQNWMVTQGATDMMYFANSDGLLEYDGLAWNLYSDPHQGKLRCAKSIGDRIYVGTVNDFGYYSYDSIQNFTYTSLTYTNELKFLGNLWNVVKFDNQIVFQTTLGLIFFENDKLVKIIRTGSRFGELFLVNDQLFSCEETLGLKQISNYHTYLMPNGEFFKNYTITSILPYDDNELLIATKTKGVFIYDEGKISEWSYPVNKFLKSNSISTGIRYHDGSYIFGTTKHGIVVVSSQGDIIQYIDKDRGLGNNSVLSIHEDYIGNVWCGLENGISHIQMHSSITFLPNYYDLGSVYVQQKIDDAWYLGTNQGLFTIDNSNFVNQFKQREDFVEIPGSNGQVWSLYSDGKHILCGHDIGVFEINGGFAQNITPWYVRGVWNFLEVPNRPDLLICGTYSGLILLRKADRKWTFVKRIDKFYASAHYIEWDKYGKLWVADGKDIVYCLSFESDYQSILDINKFEASYFGNGNDFVVNKVFNEVVISSSVGLFKAGDKQIEEETFISAILPDDFLPSIIRQDRYNDFWVFSNDEVVVLRFLEDGSYQYIDRPLFPLKQQTIEGVHSLFVIDDEQIIFGTEDGVAKYSSNTVTEYDRSFKIHIREFKSISDTISYQFLQGLEENFTSDVEFIFPYDKNSFEFEYSTTTFNQADQIEYSFKLEPSDFSEDVWTKNTSAQFTRLREGEYQFTVKARNVWGGETDPISVRFKVLPPWYRSFYARFLYFICTILVFSLFFRLFMKKMTNRHEKETLKEHNRFLERETQLKEEALKAEQEMIQFKNDTLRDEMIFKEKELANSKLSIIQKNEFLSSIKGQIKKVKPKASSVEDISRQLTGIAKSIDKNLDSDTHWEMFELHLEHVHEDFLKRLTEKHDDLSSKEMKLSAYIRMRMSSKEIATLLNISAPAVDNLRYKLRKKIGLAQGDNLTIYICDL